MLRPEQREAAPAVARLHRAVALDLEGFGKGLPERRLVLDDEDRLRHASESTENC